MTKLFVDVDFNEWARVIKQLLDLFAFDADDVLVVIVVVDDDDGGDKANKDECLMVIALFSRDVERDFVLVVFGGSFNWSDGDDMSIFLFFVLKRCVFCFVYFLFNHI